MGCALWRWRARAPGPPVRKGHGTTRLRHRYRRWQTGPCHAPWRRLRDQCQDRRPGSRCQKSDPRERGSCVLVALPPGEFPVPLVDVVANCIPIRGSFVGTRQDMAEALAFAVDGKVKADIELQPLSSINKIFDRLERGDVPSRVVLDFAPSKAKNQRSEQDQHLATTGAGSPRVQ